MGQTTIETWLDTVVVGFCELRPQRFLPALETWVSEDPALLDLHLRLHRSRQSRMAMDKDGWCTDGLQRRIRSASKESPRRFTA